MLVIEWVSKALWLVVILTTAARADPSGAYTCAYTERGTQRWKTTYYNSCGWWGNSRCVRHKTYFNKNILVNRRRCCQGSRQSGNSCVIDCLVNGWNNWSSCTNSCYPGTRSRYRYVSRNADRGYGCPTLAQATGCNSHLNKCDIDRKCWDNGYINTVTCRYCDASTATRNAWQKQSGAKCNDGNACTKDDTCSSGVCRGTSFTCSSCEYCTGSGCAVKKGYCKIQGKCYSHGATNPDSPQCQYCNAPTSWATGASSWTNRPTGTRCSDGNDCTRNDQCDANGQCQPGYNYKHECASPCQDCSAGGTCVNVRGCEIGGKCGCYIGGKCYADRALQPGRQCDHCNYGANPTGWTRIPDGTTCTDGNQCTYQDECKTGTCAGKAYTCPIGGPCMDTNTCNGNAPPHNCVPAYKSSSVVCYRNQDACDHPDTKCTGTLAACPVTTLKPLTATPIVTGSIALRATGTITSLGAGPINHFNLGSISGVYLASSASMDMFLTGYTVPCGDVTYSVTLYHMQTSFAIPSGGNLIKNFNAKSSSNSPTTIPISTSFLQNNVYRLQVSASNVRGNTLTTYSLPVLVDTTGPTLSGQLYDGNKPVSTPLFADVDYQAITNQLWIHWNIADLRDAESGIDLNSYKMSIGTSSGGDDIVSRSACTLADLSKGVCSVAGLNLQSGTKYYSSLDVTSRAGVTTRLTSNGVTPDNSPPNAGQLSFPNLPVLLSDTTGAQVQNKATRSLDFKLVHTSDPQSHLKSLVWWLCDTTAAPTVCSTQGYKPFSCASFPCTTTITQPADKITLPTRLIDNHVYNLLIRVTNNAGLSSEVRKSFRVDATPPVVGTVNDGLTGDLMYQSSKTTFSANWNSFKDVDTGIDHYEWAVYKKTGKVRLGNVLNAGKATSGTTTGLNMVHGTIYMACVNAVDRAGNKAEKCSDGLTIDAVPPAAGTVLDIDPSGGSLIDIDYQSDAARLKTRWQGFTALSGILSYSWGIGTAPGQSDVIAMQSYGLASMGTKSSLKLNSGTKYYSVIKCTSRSGLTTTVSSDGVTVDTSPPVVGSIFDLCVDNCGSLDDIDFTASNTKFSLRWSGFSDSQSGIKGYFWNYAYCGRTILLHSSDIDAGTATRSEVAVSVTTGVKYCMQVRVVNKAGLMSTAWSNGVLVDITPPDDFLVVDGPTLSDDIDHQDSNSTLTASWSASADAQSGMSHITIGAGTRPSALDVRAPVSIDKALLSYTLTGFKLTDLTEYHLTVCYVNRAKLSKCFTTDGSLVDVTAPTKGIILTGEGLKGQLYQSSTTELKAQWSAFEDVHSDIAEFKVAVGTHGDATAIRNYYSVGLKLSTIVSNLALVSGTSYIVTVAAVNNAGSTETSRSAGIIIDNTPPVFQYKPKLELKGTRATLSWPGVVDQESSVWYYRWAMGVSCNGNQMFGYFNEANGTTSAQRTLTSITGQAFYGTVVARNRAGLSKSVCTDPVWFDGTPPVMQEVTIGLGDTSAKFFRTAGKVPCSWGKPTDHESGVTNCTAEILDFASGTIHGVLQLQSINTTSGNVPVSVPLQDGKQYQCRVMCRNGVGAVASSTSAVPALFDSSPPMIGHINIAQYWPKSSELDFTWAPCIDRDSEITDYHWGVGTPASLYSTQASTSAGVSLQARSDTIRMTEGGTYIITLICKNGAGSTKTMTSQAFTVDTTPPVVASSVKVDFDLTDSALSAQWAAATDSVSGIRGYEWSIGVSPGGCQVLDNTFIGDVMNATCSNCSIKSGEKYYIAVRAINNANLTTHMSTSTITVDSSAPIAGRVYVAKEAAGSKTITIGCEKFMDNEAGIEQCTWLLKNNSALLSEGSTGCQCQNCTFDVLLPAIITQQDSATSLSVDVMCKNRVSLSVTKTLDIDVSKPVDGTLKCDAYTSNTTQINAVWSGVFDSQTAVSLRWAVGHQDIDDILSWTTGGIDSDQSQLSATGLNLVNGEHYNIILEASNSAGMLSTVTCKTTIDTTPPTAGLVQDGKSTSMDMDFISTPESISASWNGFSDAETSVTYQWCIGLAKFKQNFMTCRSVGSATRATCHTCIMSAGVTYYITVRARNKAGLVTSVSSDGITLDTSPPNKGSVQEGTDTPTSSVQYMAGDISPLIYWSGFVDQQSSIRDCSVSILAEDKTPLWSRSAVLESLSPLAPNITLPVGKKMFTRVECINKAGLASSNMSSGFVLDTTLPVTGTVQLGWTETILGEDALLVICSGFDDPESHITHFDITVVDNATDMTLHSSRVTQLNTTFTIPIANLSDGEVYSATISASNRVGLSSQVTTEPIVYDTTPPSIGTVLDGPVGSKDENFTSDSTRLQAHWESIQDPDSDIIEFYWAIGTNPGGTQILPYTAIGLNTSAWCDPPRCVPVSSVSYFTTVRAENAARKLAWFTSDGITVDTTAPGTVTVTLNNKAAGQDVQFVNENTTIAITWSTAEDPDSPIADYSVCIGSQPEQCDVLPWQPTGLATVYRHQGLHSSLSIVYAIVKVTNAAGLYSLTTSTAMHIDNTPPDVGHVIDGGGMSDADCQDASQPLVAQWSGFVDQESYITDYHWAIGTQPGMDNIQPWTSVGSQLSAEVASTALSQPDDIVFASVRATNGAGLSAVVSSDGVRILHGSGTGTLASSEVARLCVSFAKDQSP
ncbi:uncharacterized protein LOC135805560 [Sycon ciliatum]|uniref:uncharacterized protein LOC135805560 n=1 Tax=Sycon ciliatum TaxID=27933 RepID=UPI0020AE7E41|eukprot:scpid3349/ scgid20633/ 